MRVDRVQDTPVTTLPPDVLQSLQDARARALESDNYVSVGRGGTAVEETFDLDEDDSTCVLVGAAGQLCNVSVCL